MSAHFEPDPEDFVKDEPQAPQNGACGQRHADVRGACDLDPMNEPPADAAPDEEKRLKEALYALNRAVPFSGDGWTVDAESKLGRSVVRVRDEVWALGQDLYGWTD